MTRPISDQAGFTLLEAVVAVALLAAVLVPIYALIGTALRSAFHLGEVGLRDEIAMNALEAVQALNPMETPAGDLDLGTYRVHWEAQLVRGPLESSGYPRGTGLYRTALYDTGVSVSDRNDKVIETFTVRQVGYQRVRSLLAPFTQGGGL